MGAWSLIVGGVVLSECVHLKCYYWRKISSIEDKKKKDLIDAVVALFNCGARTVSFFYLKENNNLLQHHHVF